MSIFFMFSMQDFRSHGVFTTHSLALLVKFLDLVPGSITSENHEDFYSVLFESLGLAEDIYTNVLAEISSQVSIIFTISVEYV